RRGGLRRAREMRCRAKALAGARLGVGCSGGGGSGRSSAGGRAWYQRASPATTLQLDEEPPGALPLNLPPPPRSPPLRPAWLASPVEAPPVVPSSRFARWPS